MRKHIYFNFTCTSKAKKCLFYIQFIFTWIKKKKETFKESDAKGQIFDYSEINVNSLGIYV